MCSSALRQEAAVLAALPVDVPAPRMIGAVRLTVDDADWQVVRHRGTRGTHSAAVDTPRPRRRAQRLPRERRRAHPGPTELSLPLLTDELTDDRRSLEYFDDLAAGTATADLGSAGVARRARRRAVWSCPARTQRNSRNHRLPR
jgi:hypothetical protein